LNSIMTTRALAVNTPGAKFERTTIERQPVGDNDIRIETHFAGICHSDIHQAREEWGSAIFPMVPGHEIAGIVTEVGAKVQGFKVGDRAGVGTFVDSCGECEPCKWGEENYCRRGNVQTYNGRYYPETPGHGGTPSYGGYSTDIVLREDFALHIADSLPLDAAAPLLCAGITVYSPLRHWQAGPGKKVAILGMGGLGHMAVKFAVAMGAHVTVLGRTLAKREDALRFGAHDYRATADANTIEDLSNAFDLIVNTTSANIPVDDVLSMLRVDGTLVNVGVAETAESFHAFSLIPHRRAIAGSNTGGIRETQEMLDFCAEHGILSEIEVIDADYVDTAWERVVNSDVRYRFVIDAKTI
jgi:alcohol dehydrogenase (NADP+)